MIDPALALLDPLEQIEQGHRLADARRFAEAESCFLRALEQDPELAMAHNNLGWVRQMRGDLVAAVAAFEKALTLSPSLDLARANLAALLSEQRRFAEARPLWDELVRSHSDNWGLLNEAIDFAMRAGQMRTAADYAERCALAFRGSRWYRSSDDRIAIPATPTPTPVLTPAKLHHDLEQLRYLQARKIPGRDLSDLIDGYEQVLTEVAAQGDRARCAVGPREQQLLGDTYGRISFMRPTPRLPGEVLSNRWDHTAAEEEYLQHELGITVIDDFLTDEALDSLRQFCLQSTVWLGNGFGYGRLGATFREGFNCPLLIQIAEELEQAFPRVLGEEHPLLQLWGFKYGQHQPETAPHADFAAVNVNFWLTPEEANLDQETGGLVIYDVKAPADWDFSSYNANGEKVMALIEQTATKRFTVPYRANRAMIFNSDLFHATAPLRFADGYENRRINVTMLFGRRGNRSAPEK